MRERTGQTYNALVKPSIRPSIHVQESIVAALRGVVPRGEATPEEIAEALKIYECGGYLHRLWKDRAGEALPEAWAEGFRRAHHKTLTDSLSALVQLREVAGVLDQLGIPFVLMKGAAYLAELYRDPGTRVLTDIDLLIPEDGIHRVGRSLATIGFQGDEGAHYPEFMRFEMFRPGITACRFEFHWSLGVPGRMNIDQRAIWAAVRPCSLEGIRFLGLPPVETLLFHVGHQADHYLGPTLKWAIDLREMLRRWTIDGPRAAELARAWGLRTAAHLALLHVGRLFPGETPEDLLVATRPPGWKRGLIAPFLSAAPAELMLPEGHGPGRMLLKPLLLDSPGDSLRLALRVAGRRPRALMSRWRAPVLRPWERGGD